ncbi:hypothetical protein PGTUg99_008670 [Puccinia graminis f. sp. tritici]|uniref:Uncharacterized protein n=1 Tax=Puccinia graminis f. sp. tritici TaxID=56615 RepID=A0A5B0Q8V1_PUCGR|nr:hypothetical protein PGTUg99_008670 [Puccinia graminis f. sp. tritici]
MVHNSHCVLVFFLLLFVLLSAAPPPPRGVSADITFEKTALELSHPDRRHWTPPPSLFQKLPRQSEASPSQESKKPVNLGAIIHQKSNLVLDRLIIAGERNRIIKSNTSATWGNVYKFRFTEQREQIGKHLAFDMIGKTFSFRVAYRVANKSEKDSMDRILDIGNQPAEIRQTISKIEQLCDIIFDGDAQDPAIEHKILEETQSFRDRFNNIFDGIYSQEIEKMIPEETNPKSMTPSLTIQNFHQKLVAIEELNQKTSILKLHTKLDQAIGMYYMLVEPHQPIKKWDQIEQPIEQWDQKSLISTLYPKLDTLFRELAIEQGYYLERYHPPSEEWDQETLILKLPTTLVGQSSYLKYLPDHYDPSIKNWDQKALILKFHKKLDNLLSQLSPFPQPKKHGLKLCIPCLNWLI